MWDGSDVFKWVLMLEDAPSDFLAELTVVRELTDWDFQFPRDIVERKEQAE